MLFCFLIRIDIKELVERQIALFLTMTLKPEMHGFLRLLGRSYKDRAANWRAEIDDW